MTADGVSHARPCSCCPIGTQTGTMAAMTAAGRDQGWTRWRRRQQQAAAQAGALLAAGALTWAAALQGRQQTPAA
jgi:hypothetical protein